MRSTEDMSRRERIRRKLSMIELNQALFPDGCPAQAWSVAEALRALYNVS
jgi:glycogen debranching enzyme